MSDILIDPITGDITLADGDVSLADGLAAIAQRVRDAFLTVKGEWFLDTTYGVPYFDDILVKNPNLAVVKARFIEAANEAIDGEATLAELEVSFRSSDRELDVTALIKLGDDSTTVTV